MQQHKIAVIGAGASGMAAAIEAARSCSAKKMPVQIVLYERMPKIGKKILATGNGRCNLMNRFASPESFNGDSDAIVPVFDQYSVDSDLHFFKSMGLYTAEEEDGRLYPMSFQATSVLDALRFEIERLQVEIRCGAKITSIQRTPDGFLLNETDRADAIIVAGGGKSASVQGSDGSCFSLLSSLGIGITPLSPALVGLVLQKKNKSLKGIRAKSEILLIENDTVVASSQGELQYTDYGISGIPAMEISREAARHSVLHKKGRLLVCVNSLPSLSPEEITDYIERRKQQNPALLCENLLSGLMPKRLGIAKLHSAGIKESDELRTLTKNQIAELTEILISELFEVSGTLGFEQSQVTAGGAELRFFHPETLEAKQIPGLFACGEALNIDGGCGGYNLTWAWSSGRCAGHHAANFIAEKSQC